MRFFRHRFVARRTRRRDKQNEALRGTWGQGGDIVSQLCRDRCYRLGLERRYVQEDLRPANVKSQRAWTRHGTPGRPRFIRTGKMTWHDWRARSSHETCNTRPEPAERTGAASRAFRKHDQDVIRAGQKLTAHVEAGSAMVLTIERQPVDDDDGEDGAESTGKEIVGRGSGKGVVHAPQWKTRKQAERVEVARMIAYHDERFAGWQILAANHVESIVGAQERSQGNLNRAAERTYDHIAVARNAPHALGGG